MNKDELIELYLGKTLSTYKIAKLKGVNPATVYNWLKRYDIQVRTKKQAWTIVDRPYWVEKLPELVKSLNAQDIADMFGEKYHTVQYHIKQLGLVGKRISAGTLERHAKSRDRYTKDELINMYCTQRMTLKNIASQCDVHTVTVLNDMKRFGIPRRSRTEASELVWTPEMKEAARERAVARPALQFGKQTDIELMFKEWAEANDIAVTPQFQLTENGHRYDYHIIGTTTLVELDGDYWHSTEKQKAKDATFNQLAADAGYTVVRLLRSDILADKNIFDLLKW